MPRLITQFSSTMAASQRAQVAALLQEGADANKYETTQAFRDALAALSAGLDAISVPLFTFYHMGAGEVIDSGRVNGEIRTMRLDMETVYTELSSIQDAVLAHRGFMERHIVDIHNSLTALNTRISTLELLADESEFNLAYINTFNMLGAEGLGRANVLAPTLYVDPRTTTALGQAFDCDVDVHREGLVLPVVSTINAPITGIELLEGAVSTSSDLPVDPQDNSLLDVLVENDGEFWVRSVLLLDTDAFGNAVTPPPAGISASVRLSLGGYRSINSVTLAPWTDGTFKLDQITYHATDGQVYNLLTTTFTLLDRVVVVFDQVEADEITLQLSQESYTELVDFTYSTAPVDQQAVFDLVGQATASLVNLGTGPGTEYASGYLYSLGFDFISVDLVSFLEKGIYVANVFPTGLAPTEVALKSTVKRGTDIGSFETDSIEFDVVKYNFNNANALIFTETFPVLNSRTIVNESLILDSDGGSTLRFFPEMAGVVVYRDNTALVDGSDFLVSLDSGLTLITLAAAATALPAGPPWKCRVYILSPTPTNSYTVSYTAATSHTPLGTEPMWLNEEKTMYVDSNSIRFAFPPGYDYISYSNLYLRILMRSFNLLATRSSPIVEEYSLLIEESDAV